MSGTEARRVVERLLTSGLPLETGFCARIARRHAGDVALLTHSLKEGVCRLRDSTRAASRRILTCLLCSLAYASVSEFRRRHRLCFYFRISATAPTLSPFQGFGDGTDFASISGFRRRHRLCFCFRVSATAPTLSSSRTAGPHAPSWCTRPRRTTPSSSTRRWK